MTRKIIAKIIVVGSPNHPKSSFGEVMEAFLGSPEVSWAVLARLGRIWGTPSVRRGVPEVVSEASWGNFGVSWGYFRTSWETSKWVWGSLGGFLGAFWEHFWKIFCYLEPNVKIAKNLRKPMVFH